jgi:5-methyltetrahydrofolate--homocysteine methyltransferase
MAWRAPADGKFKIAKRAYEQATQEAGLAASDIFLRSTRAADLDRHRRRPPQRARDDRSDPSHQARPARRVHDSRRIERLVWSVTRLAYRSQFGFSFTTPVEAGLDSAIVNASKIEPLNRIGEQELKVARELIYDQRRFEGDVCVYDPLTGIHQAVRRREGEEHEQVV